MKFVEFFKCTGLTSLPNFEQIVEIYSDVNLVRHTTWIEPTYEQVKDEECRICYVKFEDDDLILSHKGKNSKGCIILHNFHKDCIYNWLLEDRKCPVCRQN